MPVSVIVSLALRDMTTLEEFWPNAVCSFELLDVRFELLECVGKATSVDERWSCMAD